MDELPQQMARLMEENAALNQRLEALAAQQTQQVQQVQIRLDLLLRLVDLPNQMAAAMRNPQAARSLYDNRGLGRPPTFCSKELEFRVWSRKVETYI